MARLKSVGSNSQSKPTVRLGGFISDNPDRKQWANFGVKPEDQHTGIFTAPHGIAFAKNGDLYVQDWNATGRVTKLRRK